MFFNKVSYSDFTFLEKREIDGTVSSRGFVLNAGVKKCVRKLFFHTYEYVGIYKSDVLGWRFTENDDPVPEQIENLIFSWEIQNKRKLTLF